MDLLEQIEVAMVKAGGTLRIEESCDYAIEDICPPEDSIPPSAALRASIEAMGIIEPLLLARGGNGRLQIINGRRRFLAANEAGFDTVPAIVLSCEEASVMDALILAMDNLRAENPVASARAAGRLIEQGADPDAIKRITGLDKRALAKLQKLAVVEPGLLRKVTEGTCAPKTAMAVAKLPEEARRRLIESPEPITGERVRTAMQVERSQHAVELPAEMFLFEDAVQQTPPPPDPPPAHIDHVFDLLNRLFILVEGCLPAELPPGVFEVIEELRIAEREHFRPDIERSLH